jgi:hypothetical protein
MEQLVVNTPLPVHFEKGQGVHEGHSEIIIPYPRNCRISRDLKRQYLNPGRLILFFGGWLLTRHKTREIVDRHLMETIVQVARNLRIGMERGICLLGTGFIHAIEVHLNRILYLIFIAHNHAYLFSTDEWGKNIVRIYLTEQTPFCRPFTDDSPTGNYPRTIRWMSALFYLETSQQ